MIFSNSLILSYGPENLKKMIVDMILLQWSYSAQQVLLLIQKRKGNLWRYMLCCKLEFCAYMRNRELQAVFFF